MTAQVDHLGGEGVFFRLAGPGHDATHKGLAPRKLLLDQRLGPQEQGQFLALLRGKVGGVQVFKHFFRRGFTCQVFDEFLKIGVSHVVPGAKWTRVNDRTQPTVTRMDFPTRQLAGAGAFFYKGDPFQYFRAALCKSPGLEPYWETMLKRARKQIADGTGNTYRGKLSRRHLAGRFVRASVACFLLASMVALVEAETPQGPKIELQANIMVPMRDGIKLATDVYLPAVVPGKQQERLPVILSRIPYNKDVAKRAGNYFASHGYAFVAQDTRGRYGSEGVWKFLTDDGVDGKDCAAWIGKQPWSNGRIGMLGTSYVGGTQHTMALADVPELATVIPVDAASNMGRQGMRNAGAFEMRFWNWIMLKAGLGSVLEKDPAVAAELKALAENRTAYLPQLPLRRGATPLRLAPEYEDWLVEAMNHGADDEFWAPANILADPAKYKDIPVYLVGGWYDSWAGNTTANYAALSRTLKSPVYLMMGPWIHGQQTKGVHGQVDFGDEAAIKDEWAWRKEWFDHWLKGQSNAVGSAAPFASKVRIFVMGTGDGGKNDKGMLRHGGSWRDEQEWPLARAVATPMYLHAGGGLQTEKPPAKEAATTYDYDPRDPVPTWRERLLSRWHHAAGRVEPAGRGSLLELVQTGAAFRPP